MQQNNRKYPQQQRNQQQQPNTWSSNGLNSNSDMSNGMGQKMMPGNYNRNSGGLRIMPVSPQYPGMQQPQNMSFVMPNNGMQMQGMAMQPTNCGMQPSNFSASHPVNCPCRTAQIPTYPPQPQGIPLMPVGGAEFYPINLSSNGQMCMAGPNYASQSYIEPGMYVDPAQWKEICKQQSQAGHVVQGATTEETSKTK